MSWLFSIEQTPWSYILVQYAAQGPVFALRRWDCREIGYPGYQVRSICIAGVGVSLCSPANKE